MAEIDDGGPAFAFSYEERASDYGPGGWTAHSGMSLRDYYIGQALIGLIARGSCGADAVAVQARTFADAAIKARKP